MSIESAFNFSSSLIIRSNRFFATSKKSLTNNVDLAILTNPDIVELQKKD